MWFRCILHIKYDPYFLDIPPQLRAQRFAPLGSRALSRNHLATYKNTPLVTHSKWAPTKGGSNPSKKKNDQFLTATDFCPKEKYTIVFALFPFTAYSSLSFHYFY